MGWAFSYGRGIPVQGHWRMKSRASEALGQLGQDEPASGMALEPLDGLCPIGQCGHWNTSSASELRAPPSRTTAATEIHAGLLPGLDVLDVPYGPRQAYVRVLQGYAHKKVPTPPGQPYDPRHSPTVGS